MAKRTAKKTVIVGAAEIPSYGEVFNSMVELLEHARRASARSVNAIMTATYWEVGRRIVEYEQRGEERVEYYGKELVDRLSDDLSQRFGRGFGRANLFQMRAFYLAYAPEIVQTLSGQSLSRSIHQTASDESSLPDLTARFPLSWSHYVRLLRRLRSLVVIDLKLGEFTHADAGQMHLYLNYAREHWTHPDENPPVGLILCTEKNEAVAHYALEGLPNRVLAAEYRTALPDEQVLVEEVERTRRALEARTEVSRTRNR
jgi:hypothetical protein